MFPPGWRQRTLARLDRPFDLVVVGGGITGCGVFLDAAQRGLQVLLVERGDLASGTSSRSSKLIHGGLRYLRQGQLRTTRESCRERDRQIALHPHLVTPLRFVYPAYRGDRVPGWQVELGLRLYDRLARGAEPHARLAPGELAALAPGLRRDRLDRALVFTDARADDARLTLAVAATGVAYGGALLTRAAVEDGRRDAGGRLRRLVVRDLESGDTREVETLLAINAGGVWVDRLRHRLGCEGRRLRPSRGSHLVFAPDRFELGAALSIPSPDDRRPVFVIPHPEGILVGTTDLFHDGDLDDPRPTAAEIDYLLRATAAAFPDDPPRRAEVRGAFAGLRPVLDHGHDNPSRASRDEAIWHERGLLTVAGGKLTTWRAMAEAVVNRALRLLPPERARRAAPCATAGTPLAGLAPADLGARLAARGDLDPAIAAALARRLGALAWTARELARDPSELRPLHNATDLTPAELRVHLRFGAVRHLSDLLLRRLRLGMWHPELADELLPLLREPVCRELGWDGERWDRERERYARAAEGWKPLRDNSPEPAEVIEHGAQTP